MQEDGGVRIILGVELDRFANSGVVERILYDIGKIITISSDGRPTITADAWQNYSALPTLHKLQANYPNLFHLKLMGTHAKYWICDRKFAYVGSHNVLSSNTSYLDLAGEEVGTLHTSPRNIQKLIHCFETQPNLSR